MVKKAQSPEVAQQTANTAQLVRQLYAAGRVREALVVAENALREAGDGQRVFAELFNLAGACALGLKDLARAERHFRQALICNPDYVEVPGNLAVVLMQLGKLDEADAALARAIALRPDHLNLYGDRIGLLMHLQRYAEAESTCRQLLVRSPGHAVVHNTLGLALARQGRGEEAEVEFRLALQRQPDFPEAHFNLGNALLERKALDEAEAAFKAVLAAMPGHLEALNNLGNLYRELARHPEAEAQYRRVVELEPKHAVAWGNLGNVLVTLNREDEAQAALRREFELLGAQAGVWCPLVRFLHARSRLPDVIAVLRQLLVLRPSDPYLVSVLISMQCQIADWSGLEQLEATLCRALEGPVAADLEPYSLLAIPGIGGEQLRQGGLHHAEIIAGVALAVPPLRDGGSVPKARLHIGYLCAEFHDHATYFLLAGVLDHHDPERVAVTLYSCGKDSDSGERRRLLAGGAVFKNLRTLSDEEAARVIADDGVDILVDIKGFTTGQRPGITARRPAPVIANWLGYPGSFGHPRLADYFIGDAVASPPEHAGHFSETLALMPHSYQPNDNRRRVGATPTRAEVGLPETGLVFCSFNQIYKIRPEIFALWCRLLLAVPDSVLWLLRPWHEQGVANLFAAAASHGVVPERIVFADMVPQADHLGRLALADLALDTFPICSHTTASDALWVGVPLITRPGETFVSRVAASVLCAAGLPELVVGSDEAVFELALALATDPARLAALKARFAAQRLSCPLFDTVRFTRDLETLYHNIWTQECAGTRRIVRV